LRAQTHPPRKSFPRSTLLSQPLILKSLFSFFLNWRNILAIIAIVIVSGTIFYSQYLTKKIAADERKKVRVWAESLKTKSTTVDPNAINLTNIIANENNDIPIIETDEQDLPTGNFLNLDAQKTKKDSLFLENAAKTFQFQNNILNAGNLYKNMNTT
jgi:hypothetical protein